MRGDGGMLFLTASCGNVPETAFDKDGNTGVIYFSWTFWRVALTLYYPHRFSRSDFFPFEERLEDFFPYFLPLTPRCFVPFFFVFQEVWSALESIFVLVECKG